MYCLFSNPARMIVTERISNELLKVDLETSQSKSMRDSFLYTGLARERPGVLNFKMQLKVRYPHAVIFVVLL